MATYRVSRYDLMSTLAGESNYTGAQIVGVRFDAGDIIFEIEGDDVPDGTVEILGFTRVTKVKIHQKRERTTRLNR